MGHPKVCIFTETYYPVVGGGETQAKAMAEGLSANGLNVTVVTRRSHSELKKLEEYGPVTVHRLAPVGRQHYKKWGLIISSLPTLVRLRNQYDIVFVSGFRIIGIPAVLVSKLFGKICVLKADSSGEMSGDFFAAGLSKVGTSQRSIFFRAFLSIRNRLLRRADAFVAISSELRRELEEYGVDPEKIHDIPNSVDVERFRPVSMEEKMKLRRKFTLPEDGKIVIYTGRLVSYKGLPLLLEVWREIRDKNENVYLLLVGSGGLDMHNCEDELKAYVAAHKMESTVRFTGEVENVHEYLQAADIFVFPTESEAFGISLIEAMACEVPVIATSVGGLKDILFTSENGLAIQAQNNNELLQALGQLLEDPDLCLSLGHTARQSVQEQYTTEIVTQTYSELFGKFLRETINSPH